MIYTICVMIGLTFFAACENKSAKNVSPESASDQIKTDGKSGYGIDDSANENASVIANNKAVNIEDNAEKETRQDNFKGTTGIVDKKYDVKSTAVLKEVRTGRHANYERVVFEFANAEMPSYHIEYIDKPVRDCGSGKAHYMKGDGWLEIRFAPAAMHDENGQPTINQRERFPDYKIIREMRSTCDFEANVEWVLGVSSPNEYRVLELKNPTRLAVDIKN